MAEFTGYLEQMTTELQAGKLSESRFEDALSLMEISLNPSFGGRHLAELRTSFAGETVDLGLLSGVPKVAQSGNARDTVSFGDVPGWKIKMENGQPVMQDGQLVIQHDGTMIVKTANLDSIEVPYDTAGTDSYGNTTIKLDVGSQPIEANIPEEGALLSLLHEKAGGRDTCSACISSYLLAASHPEGIGALIASGDVQTPLDLQVNVIGKVGGDGANVNHTDLFSKVSTVTDMVLFDIPATSLNREMISGWAKGNLTLAMLASKGPAVYVATDPYRASVADNKSAAMDSHTYIIAVDAQGNSRIIDPYVGSISDFSQRKVKSLSQLTGDSLQHVMQNLGLLEADSASGN